jgi:hypothetical protein
MMNALVGDGGKEQIVEATTGDKNAELGGRSIGRDRYLFRRPQPGELDVVGWVGLHDVGVLSSGAAVGAAGVVSLDQYPDGAA